MAKFKVGVTEVYYKEVEVEAPDAQTAETLVEAQWDQGRHDLTRERDRFDHVEFGAELIERVEHGADADV